MNIRAALFTFALLLLTFIAPTAGAVEFSMISPITITVAAGESFTLDIALDNTLATLNNGVVGTIFGLATASPAFVVTSGVSADQHFVAGCSSTQCFGGIFNNNNAGFDNDNLQNGTYTPGDAQVTIVSSLAFAEGSANGSQDPGLDGVFGQHDPSDVLIDMVGLTVGTHVLTVGGVFGQIGAQQPITDIATVTLNIIPEPGTALLMGLGLAGLAARGLRK